MIMIQHPYKLGAKIELQAMLVLVDNLFERLHDLDCATENGIDFIGESNRVLNNISSRLENPVDKKAFTAAAIERYVGE